MFKIFKNTFFGLRSNCLNIASCFFQKLSINSISFLGKEQLLCLKTNIFFIFIVSVFNVLNVQAQSKPNILIILVDDMGYSDIGCYGGEIHTPNIDKLAARGIKFSQMYNTSKCYPTRASLLTGAYYQRTNLDYSKTATLGEVLQPAGYHTWWVGKNHARFNPVTRGFEHFYGLIGPAENHFNPFGKVVSGQPNPPIGTKTKLTWNDDLKKITPIHPKFYDTDDITNQALKWMDESKKDNKPFMLYVSYFAPHDPLQAWPEDIAKYKGVYDGGFEAVRLARYKRQIELGLIDPKTSPLPQFESEMDKQAKKKNKGTEASPDEILKEAKAMEIYAAMVDRVDQNIGRMVDKLKAQGKLDNTLILFLSDNGANAKIPNKKTEDPDAPMGSVWSSVDQGPHWATVSNTPLRKWKQDSYEGGIATPLIINWSSKIQPQKEWYREPAHLIDIMPTVLEVSGAKFPGSSKQENIASPDGVSLVPAFKAKPLARQKPIFFQFASGSAIRDGKWKLSRSATQTWNLYDMSSDRTETQNLAPKYPEIVKKMDNAWLNWWKECTGSEWTGKALSDKDE